VLLKLARLFLCLALFSVVIILPKTTVAFAGEYYFFRVTVEAALACLILWWGFEAPPGALHARLARIATDPLFRAVSLFVLAFLAACLFANDRNAAFWSGYVRGDGGFQMLHNYAFFVLLFLLFDTAGHWRRALMLTVLAACLCIGYGLLGAAVVPSFQGYLDSSGNPIAPTFLGRLFSSVRFRGPMAGAEYFSATMLFAMAFALYLAFTSRRKPDRVRRLGYGGLVGLPLIFLILSQTRGAVLAVIAATVSFFAYLAFADARYRRHAAAGILVLATLAVIAFSVRNSLTEENPAYRLLHINVRDESVLGRLLTWNSAWQGFLERPLLGWGPENFDTVFERYFDPRHHEPAALSGKWFDRAHSVVFEYLATTGLIGFAAYASIFAVFYAQFFRRLRRQLVPGDDSYPLSSSMQALFFSVPVAYLVQGLFFFDVLPIYLNLFMFLALSAEYFRCRA
jgi:O-antigen ligase